MPVNEYEITNFVCSTRKQANYATLLADADLTKRLPMLSADVSQTALAVVSDAARYGKGHEFATSDRELLRDVRRVVTAELNSFLFGWLAAFGLGSLTTSTLTPGQSYQHVAKFQPLSDKQIPVTTLYEELGTGLKRKLHAMAVAEFSLSGRSREVVQSAASLIGSGQETRGALTAVPAMTPVVLLVGGDVTVNYGPQGAPVSFGDRLREWSVRLSQQPDADGGYTPGSGKYRSRLLVTRRVASCSFVVEVDEANADLFDALLNRDTKELAIALDGLTIGSSADTHGGVIRFPAVRLTAVEIGVDNGRAVYRVDIGEEQVLKDGSNEPVTLTVRNDVPNYLV